MDSKMKNFLHTRVKSMRGTGAVLLLLVLFAGCSDSKDEIEAQQEGETLVIVASFGTDSNVAADLATGISTRADNAAPGRVRVEEIGETIEPGDLDAARQVGTQYAASMIIWGFESELRIRANVLHLTDEDLIEAPTSINQSKLALVEPESFLNFVVGDLTDQLTFLSMHGAAHAWYTAGEFDEATTLLLAALDHSEGAPGELVRDANFRLGFAAHRDGDFEEAISWYDDALSFDSREAGIYSNRGAANSGMGNIPAALRDFEIALSIDPHLARALSNFGGAASASCKQAEALAALNQAIDLESGLGAAWANRGKVLLDLGRHQEAIADFDEAIDLIPDDAVFYSNRGSAKAQLGLTADALVDFNLAIELDSNLNEAFSNRANAYMNMGDYVNAISDLNIAIEGDAGSFVAYYNRAIAKANTGLHSEAIPDYSQAIAIASSLEEAGGPCPDSQLDVPLGQYHYDRGNAYLNSGDLERALSDYDRAEELGLSIAFLYNNRGVVYHTLEQYDEAIDNYDRVIELAPGDPDGLRNRAFAHGLNGDLAASATDLRAFVESASPGDARVEEAVGLIAQLEMGQNPFGE